MAEPSSIPIQDENNCPIKVVHDRKRRQFQVRLNDSHERAVLLYEYVGKKTIDLQHTEVPDAYRGRGIAKLMAKVAMKPRNTMGAISERNSKHTFPAQKKNVNTIINRPNET
ncbi:protein NATD1-like isoform X2 [Mobula hypostoma]|uniref:protein NATD1-like isoform X2 n=1 Tax=Mobula hypostoma TaxID=723540 RepID=UPI002FC38D3E